jgi:hypothetical protein
MFKKSIIVFLLSLMTFSLAAAAEVSNPAPVSKRAGYALLDQYISAFNEMVAAGTKDSLDGNLNKIISEAKKAKIAGDIDTVFLARYSRIVAITKLVLLKDPEKMLAPILDTELDRFIRDTLGEEMKKEGPGAIAQLANALAFSIVDLQVYLDTLDSRQERYDKFVKKFDSVK